MLVDEKDFFVVDKKKLGDPTYDLKVAKYFVQIMQKAPDEIHEYRDYTLIHLYQVMADIESGKHYREYIRVYLWSVCSDLQIMFNKDVFKSYIKTIFKSFSLLKMLNMYKDNKLLNKYITDTIKFMLEFRDLLPKVELKSEEYRNMCFVMFKSLSFIDALGGRDFTKLQGESAVHSD